jgi:hypothetical protein
MNNFNFEDFYTNRKRYDTVREFCRCEKIDEDYFRSSVRGNRHRTVSKIISSILMLILNKFHRDG